MHHQGSALKTAPTQGLEEVSSGIRASSAITCPIGPVRATGQRPLTSAMHPSIGLLLSSRCLSPGPMPRLARGGVMGRRPGSEAARRSPRSILFRETELAARWVPGRCPEMTSVGATTRVAYVATLRHPDPPFRAPGNRVGAVVRDLSRCCFQRRRANTPDRHPLRDARSDGRAQMRPGPPVGARLFPRTGLTSGLGAGMTLRRRRIGQLGT